MKVIIAILCLAAVSAQAQQDIDLTGYNLVFFRMNLIPAASVQPTERVPRNGAIGRRMVPQERSAFHTG